jgi:hypothetical protein
MKYFFTWKSLSSYNKGHKEKALCPLFINAENWYVVKNAYPNKAASMSFKAVLKSSLTI